jgi:hypothetical protein
MDATAQEQPSKHNVIVAAALQLKGELPEPAAREDARDDDHWPEDLNCHV